MLFRSIYADLERGWRITMPNLEQTGLLRIEYVDLAAIAADQSSWDGKHKALRDAGPGLREDLARILLDELPDLERRVVLLRFYRNRTQSQIAEELGMSQMQVSRLLARSLASMRTAAEAA